MKHHEFDPGALLTGLVFVALATAYFLDASGAWDVHWRPAVVLGGAGVVLGGLVSSVNRAVRAGLARSRPSPRPDTGDDDLSRHR